MTTANTQPPLATILTIAGSDSSAGAGIQADLKTIHALGGYALTAITAITAQNSQGVQQVFPVSVQQLQAQLNAIQTDYQIDAIKIGMLANKELIKVVVAFLQKHKDVPVVLDPIIQSSSGKALLNEDATNYLLQQLVPLSRLMTPNLPELNRLLSRQFLGRSEELCEILAGLKANHWPNTLVKGGHSAEALSTDYLLLTEAEYGVKEELYAFPATRINTQNSHGTGCTLSSAIATQLAFKRSLPEAVKLAKNYLQNALATADYAQPSYQEAVNLKKARHGGLNHFGQKAVNILDEEE